MCAALFGLIAVCSTMTFGPVAAPLREKRGAIEKDVEVAVRRRIDARDALDRSERRGQLLRDDAWRLAQPSGELERDGQRRIAQRAARRRLDDQRRMIGRREAEVRRERMGDRGAKAGVNRKNHQPPYCTRA
jgi:hypothetical protein